jgi:hypothetical protein
MISGGANASMSRKAGEGDAEIIIERLEMPLNSGFKERIYIDGVQKLVLGNGESGKVIVSQGDHVIYAELYTLTTPKLPFSASSTSIKFTIAPYSLQDFVVEQSDDAPVLAAPTPALAAAPAAVPAAAAASVAPAPVNNNSVEGSLTRAADQIITRIPPKSKIAIVYVTSKDEEITEYIANELEFIMVDQGLMLIDRSQLDRLRQEQNFQISGEVDDNQAVSLGKIAGANIIITGAVTGNDNLRRLRLRALSTETAQVVAAASEKF